MNDTIGYGWGDATPLNPALGFGGLHVNIPKLLQFSLDIDQDGNKSFSGSWTWAETLSYDVNGESGGWNTPTPFVQLGETYTKDGAYGTLSLGTKFVGGHFAVHENNPTSGMEASEQTIRRYDPNGNLVGYTLEEHRPDSKHGWVYVYTPVDLNGKVVGTAKTVPMPIENQQYYVSGVPPKCFPAQTPIAISATQTKPIEDICLGDTVMSFDPAADLGRGALVPRKVVRLYRNTTEEWIKLTWAEGGEAKELITTPGHHFLDQFGNFPTIEEMLENSTATVILASGETTEVNAERITYSADTAHLFEQMLHAGLAVEPEGLIAA